MFGQRPLTNESFQVTGGHDLEKTLNGRWPRRRCNVRESPLNTLSICSGVLRRHLERLSPQTDTWFCIWEDLFDRSLALHSITIHRLRPIYPKCIVKMVCSRVGRIWMEKDGQSQTIQLQRRHDDLKKVVRKAEIERRRYMRTTRR